MALQWRGGDGLLNKVVVFVFLLLHSIQIEPLMPDGLCLSYFSELWLWYSLGSQRDSHKHPGSHPKYLNLCSEDERSFYVFERHGGKRLMTILIVGWSNPFNIKEVHFQNKNVQITYSPPCYLRCSCLSFFSRKKVFFEQNILGLLWFPRVWTSKMQFKCSIKGL